jgi:aspartyl-tRNA(Asn)/glutamyl-tRNA(Gln) amidotransferase subunit B
MGYPGVLPTLNEEAIRMGYIVARALGCTLAPKTTFERKNYYYPDLPKNYQISQFGSPLGTDGFIDIDFHTKRKRVRIHECHLEEDAGKMIHVGDMSLLDYNRAGTPLLEIVTEPDLEVGEEAEVLLHELRRMVRYLSVCDGNMDEGSMRCDANVSVNVRGAGLGEKVEIKNLNSSRFVRLALNHEIERQQEILERGGTVVQETRLWNENRDQTESMRTKESAYDYRYFPEPDLPPFTAGDDFLHSVEDRLVELPLQRRDRFINEYRLLAGQADFLCQERDLADFFEDTVGLGADATAAASWLGADVRKLLNRRNTELRSSPLTSKRLAELLVMLGDNRIHGKIAKQTLEAVFAEDKDPEAIIAERGWEQITDRGELSRLVDECVVEHPKAVDDIAAGNTKPIGFLVGQVMRKTSGRADPQIVQELLRERLEVRVIQVLSFGGAISGTRGADGLVGPGDLPDLDALFTSEPLPKSTRLRTVNLGRFLSEEITPADWSVLIDTVASILRDQDAAGIVVGHGTDTLAYTASLLYWIFGGLRTPLVLTASATTVDRSTEAEENLRNAILDAAEGDAGIRVLYGHSTYDPVNLRYERIAGTSSDAEVQFRNWNHRQRPMGYRPVFADLPEIELSHMRERLERAMEQVFIARVFPGMQADALISLMRGGVRYFVLELYDTGTANLRESPFSLRRAFEYGENHGVAFFCTSQQEGIVDFSEYVTAHELWKEGAIPMGALTTESAYTRLLAAFLNTTEHDEIVDMMEAL